MMMIRHRGSEKEASRSGSYFEWAGTSDCPRAGGRGLEAGIDGQHLLVRHGRIRPHTIVALLFLVNASKYGAGCPGAAIVEPYTDAALTLLWDLPCTLIEPGGGCACGGFVLGSGTQGLHSLTFSPPPRLLKSAWPPSPLMSEAGYLCKPGRGWPGGTTIYW